MKRKNKAVQLPNVTFEIIPGGLQRPKLEYIETPSYADIWREHDEAVARIDKKYKRRKMMLFVGIILLYGGIFIFLTINNFI